MFIQVIQGQVADEDRLRQQMDRWLAELAPGADGWLGGTYGITDDGTFVGVVRFESPEAAQRNASRPEQGTWWTETASCFGGDVTFHDCRDVQVMLAGGSDAAGFVQVIQGRVVDRDALMAVDRQAEAVLAAERPDIIGGTIAIADDGTVTETIAFTSEEAARAGERKEPSAEARRMLEQEQAAVSDMRYLDLRHPWFASRGAAVPGQREAAETEKPATTSWHRSY